MNCIDGKEKPLISLEDAIKTQKVIDAAFESSATGKLITLI